VPRNRWAEIPLSMSLEGMGLSLMVQERPTRGLLRSYIREGARPGACDAGSPWVMDKLSSYKGKRVRELIEKEAANRLLTTPLPDLNPIEEVKIKGSYEKPA